MLRWLFDIDNFVPRKDCGDWPDWLIIAAVSSNIIIGLAYFAIPLTLYVFYRKKAKDLSNSWIVLCFVAFIFACGTSHIIDALIYVIPVYRLLVVVDCITAIISFYTAIVLPKVVKVLIKQQSVEQLRMVNKQLEEEVKHRTEMEENVRKANHDLANEVARLQNVIQIQGWVTEKQMDLDAMKKVITDLRKQYARPN